MFFCNHISSSAQQNVQITSKCKLNEYYHVGKKIPKKLLFSLQLYKIQIFSTLKQILDTLLPIRDIKNSVTIFELICHQLGVALSEASYGFVTSYIWIVYLVYVDLIENSWQFASTFGMA